MDILYADRLHTLQEEHSGEAAPGDLVDEGFFSVPYTDRLEPLGEILIAEVPALQFAPGK